MQSDRFSINWNDFLKGLIMAVIMPVLAIIQNSIANGELTFNWKLIGLTAAGGFVGYLIKNFLSDNVKAAQNTLEAAAKKEQNP